MIPTKGETRITVEVIVPTSELHKVQAGTRSGYRGLIAEAMNKSDLEAPWCYEVLEVIEGEVIT